MLYRVVAQLQELRAVLIEHFPQVIGITDDHPGESFIHSLQYILSGCVHKKIIIIKTLAQREKVCKAELQLYSLTGIV